MLIWTRAGKTNSKMAKPTVSLHSKGRSSSFYWSKGEVMAAYSIGTSRTTRMSNVSNYQRNSLYCVNTDIAQLNTLWVIGNINVWSNQITRSRHIHVYASPQYTMKACSTGAAAMLTS